MNDATNTFGPPRLPADDRRTIKAVLRGSFEAAVAARAGLDDPDRAVDQWVHVTADLFTTVGNLWDFPGILELMIECSEVHMAGIGGPGAAAYNYVDDFQSSNRARDVAVRFTNAIIHDDVAAAVACMAEVQPDRQPSAVPEPDLWKMFTWLWMRAFDRWRGTPVRVVKLHGDAWPPVCDFCDLDTACGMYRCPEVAMAVLAPPPGEQSGGISVEFDDVTRWYACGSCSDLLDAAGGPDYGGLLERHRRARPDAVAGLLLPMWRQFAEVRTTRTPEVLPESRPENGAP